MRRATTLILGLALVGLLAGSWSCSETVGEIDRTQPEKIHKSLFRADKVWYYKQTIVDVPPKAAWAFEGIGSPIHKIRFEVTGGGLIAYRAHEHFPGEDPKADQEVKDIGQTHYVPGAGRGVDPEQYKEAAVGIWEVYDHFDVIRDYNTVTGEQQNVLVENRDDRPWYEREYMRVNWIANLAPNYNLLDPGLTGVAQVVNEGGEPDGSADAPHFEDVEGNVFDSRSEVVDDKVVYFDFTTNWFMEPTYCLKGEPSDCTPDRIAIRHSFWRIDDHRDQDYEPVFWDDLKQSKFGYFRTERYAYDRRRELTDSGRIYLANRHRIWERSYQRDEDGSFLRHDGDRIPIPIADRVPKPVVYALSPGHPDNLLDTAKEIAHEWDLAFRRATAHLCDVDVPNGVDIGALPVGGEGLTCAELATQGVVPHMFVLDENRDGAKRKGDLRHNYIYWVPQRQAAGPLGYGPSFPDPETGELISGVAHIYGAEVDSYASYAMDIVDVIGGFLTVEHLIEGEQVKAHIEAHRDRVDPRRIAADLAKQSGLSPEEFNALDLREALQYVLPKEARATAALLASDGLPAGSPFHERYQAQKIRGTWIEQLMLRGTAGDELVAAMSQSDEFKRLAPNWMPGDPLPEEAMGLISPANWAYGSAMREMEEDRVSFFASRNVLMADFVDESVIGLALEYENETDPERVYLDLRSQIYKATMLHEIGHTVGLRHNFEGSFDATNFHDEYWEQREPSLKNLAEQVDVPGEFYQLVEEETIVTDAQKIGRMQEYQYSSIMDYGMKFNTDFHGLGKWDHAAVLLGYANAVEVFETPRADVVTRLKDYMLRLGYSPEFDFEDYVAETWENRTHPQDPHPLKHFNYTHMPHFLGGIEGIRARRVTDYDDLRRLREEGREDVPLEVPYMFCGDEWVSSIMSCNRWDLGANYKEIQSAAISAYYNYYFFTHFRRDSIGFSTAAVQARVFDRYFRLISDTYRFGLWAGVFWGNLPDPALSYLWSRSILHGLDTLLNVVSTPEYGTYRLGDDGRYHQWKRDIELGAGNVIVPMGTGRRRHTRYFMDEGYNYFEYPLESGHFWDWQAALIALTESQFSILGVEVDSEFRSFLIPYYLLFPGKLTQWFNAMAMRDPDGYAPRVVNGSLKWLTDLEDPDEGNVINIRPDFTTQIYSMIFGMQSFQSAYSLHYVDQMQVFRLGGAEEMDPGPEHRLISFSDPITGHAYGTFEKKAGYDEDAGEFPPPPVQFIHELNGLKEMWQDEPEKSNLKARLEQRINDRVESLNILRGLYKVFGSNI